MVKIYAGDQDLISGSGRSLGEDFLVLAWEIPWTEEPGRLQPMGSHRNQIRFND